MFSWCLALVPVTTPAADAPKRANVVWVVVDDMSAHFSCYGETLISTPHVDALAARGVRFDKAFTTAPVCSPCRSALITGCYQTTIGAHHHRSGRGVEKIRLPDGVAPLPKLFHDAGYYTCVGGPLVAGTKQLAKTDYNFEWDAGIYDGNDSAGRKPGQPFFMQVQLQGGKHRGQGPTPAFEAKAAARLDARVDPARVTLPPYYPRHPTIVKDWANYLDCCALTDAEVGAVVARLAREGLLADTVVIFVTDHGVSHARGKQFLYDEGTRVPLVVAGPGVPAGRVRDDLVEHIDVAATTLALAGIAAPSRMQGRDLFAKGHAPRDAVFSARDRCDETTDRIRSVRTGRYKYIRNYLHQRPLLQPCDYKDSKAVVAALRQLHADNRLSALQEKLLFAPERPREELYDLRADPYETDNLALDPTRAKTLASLRGRLADWESRTGDLGRTPEPMAMYDSDMAVYLGQPAGKGKKKNTGVLERNVALNKAWVKAGK